MTSVQVVAVTDFRNKTKEVLDQVKEAPAILTQRSHPVAVVMDYETYRDQTKLLEELEIKLDDLILAQAVKTSQEVVSLDDMLADYEKETGHKIA
jgi:prevent-host-death family protein